MFQFMRPLFLYFFQNFPNFRFKDKVKVNVKGNVRVSIRLALD